MTLRPNAINYHDGDITLGIVRRMAPFCFFLNVDDILIAIKGKRYSKRIGKYFIRFRLKGFKASTLEEIINRDKADLILTHKTLFNTFNDNIKITDFFPKYEEIYFEKCIKIDTTKFSDSELLNEFDQIFQIVYKEAREIRIYDPQLLRSINIENWNWYTKGLNYFLPNINKQCHVTIFVAENIVKEIKKQKIILEDIVNNIRSKDTCIKYENKLEEHHGSIEINNKYKIKLDWGFSTFIKHKTRKSIGVIFENI